MPITFSVDTTSSASQLVASGKIGIAVSRYNDNITGKLLQASIATLQAHGVNDNDIVVVWGPGAWELPLLCQDLVEKPDVSAVICLGCVIRGETTHDNTLTELSAWP